MSDIDFKPVPGTVLPRFAGIPTFMRLPHILPEDDAADRVDIGLIGVPWDGGTTNRAGARHGPRQMRDQSTMMRNAHHVTGIQPYKLANCADLGDSPVNPIQLEDTLARIEAFFRTVHEKNIRPLSAGGDHLVTLPIMRASADRDRPLGMVHFDAHTDTWDRYFGGAQYTHGTPFRRAIEEGLLDPKRTIQIGIRGGLYTAEDKDWGLAQGIRVVEIEEYFDMGPDKTAALAREVVGDGPVYVSFDVDGMDPVFAPGTGTPEIGGYSTHEAQRMVRALRGLDIRGADVVEVSPPFDPSGATALAGVTIMWELLCLIAERVAAARG
jgi:guanidinopropionase